MGVKQTEAGSVVVVVDGDGARVPVSSRGGGLQSLAWSETAMMPSLALLSAQDWGRRWRLEEDGRSCEGEGRGIAV